MKFILWLVISLVALVSQAQAQKVEDSEQAVKQALGNPMAVRKTGDRDTWLYSGGRRVVFEKGAVVGSSGFSEELQADANGSGAGNQPQNGPVDSARHSSVSEVHAPSAVKKPDAAETKNASRRAELNAQWGMIFVGLGVVVSGICGILILIEAFRASVWWGLAVLFFPLAQLLFVATHWSETKKPFLVMVFVGISFGLIGLLFKS